MSHFFETNVQLLERYDPHLAHLLRAYNPTGKFDIIFDNPKFASLQVEHQGEKHLLHSRRDPQREAQRWIENLNKPPMYNLMVFGCGLMYHIVQLVMRYQEKLHKLVILEKDMDVVYAAFQTIDLTPFLKTQNTFFLADIDAPQLRNFLNNHLTDFTLDGLTQIEHAPSVQIHSQYYEEMKSIIHESLQSGEILLRTKEQLGPLIQENVIRNIPELMATPQASALASIVSGTPAFIVGAGPSLDNNISQLGKVGEKGLIIACDTVFNKLRKHGIEPHLVVTTDPTHLNLKHFDVVDDLQNSILVFSPSVRHEIPSRLKGTKVSLPMAASRFLSTLKDVLGEQNYLKLGTNVGQTCFNLASFMGCNPLILVGMDLSFPATGGTTHTDDTAWQRKIDIAKTPGKMTVELISDTPELEEFDPIYIPGNQSTQVATNKFWLAYLRSLEEEIRKTPKTVINATEGGAKITGAEAVPLSQVVETYCTRDAMISSSLQAAVGFFFAMNQQEGSAVLREGIQILETAIEYASHGLDQIKTCQTIANSRDPNPQLIKESLDQLYEVHIKLVQDQKVYIMLDEAADHILSHFLRKQNRPAGNQMTMDFIQKSISRYHRYFGEMKTICERFLIVTQVTLDEMDSSTFESSFKN